MKWTTAEPIHKIKVQTVFSVVIPCEETNHTTQVYNLQFVHLYSVVGTRRLFTARCKHRIFTNPFSGQA